MCAAFANAFEHRRIVLLSYGSPVSQAVLIRVFCWDCEDVIIKSVLSVKDVFLDLRISLGMTSD